MANKSINALPSTSTLANQDLLVLWKEASNAANSISGQDFVQQMLSLVDGRGYISSITGPVTVGLVDTYTINFTDGLSPVTFSVTNGATGATGAQTYVHIVYSNTEPDDDGDISNIPGPWIGIACDTNDTDPVHYTDYTWYEFKGTPGSPGEGVSYTVPTTIESGTLYTMYTESGTECGNFTVYNGTGDVDTVNGIAPKVGDVPITVSSVGALELSGTPLDVGSATIADAYAALQAKQTLVCPATDFATTQLPLYNGNRLNDGTIEIVKGSGTDGWIEFHGRQSTTGDFRMFFTSADVPTGTWIRSDLVSESGTPTATSGTIYSSAYVKRSGNTVVLDYAASNVDVQTSLTKIGSVPAKFAPSESVFGIGLIGFGAATPVCYAEVTTGGDIRIRGNTAQSSVAFRAHLTWIL